MSSSRWTRARTAARCGRRHRDDVAARCDQVDDPGGRGGPAPLDVEPLDRPERRADHRRVAAVIDIVRGVDDPGQLGDPVHPLVPDVPQQAEPPARGEHPGRLGHRPGRVDPVPGLRHQDGIHGMTGERDSLGRAGQGPDAGQHPGQLVAHPGGRLDGHDVEPAVAQRAGELAGARAEVEHATRARRQQPVDGLVRVGRPGPLVGHGSGPERDGLGLATFATGHGSIIAAGAD